MKIRAFGMFYAGAVLICNGIGSSPVRAWKVNIWSLRGFHIKFGDEVSSFHAFIGTYGPNQAHYLSENCEIARRDLWVVLVSDDSLQETTRRASGVSEDSLISDILQLALHHANGAEEVKSVVTEPERGLAREIPSGLHMRDRAELKLPGGEAIICSARSGKTLNGVDCKVQQLMDDADLIMSFQMRRKSLSLSRKLKLVGVSIYTSRGVKLLPLVEKV